jgi:hypothetical protein
MAIQEIVDKERIHALIQGDPIANLEAIDENLLGQDGIVSVFAPDDDPRPVNMMIVRWGQKHLGLGSIGRIFAARLTGLEDVVAAVPADRGQYDVLLPFWASPAITGAFRASVLGAEAVYVVDREHLVRSPVTAQCERLTDPEIIRPMFPKLASDAPIYVLALKGALVSVAAVTHLQREVARAFVYTVEGQRRHGFGRGVLTALAEELIALKLTPTIAVDLGGEDAVRMVENAGFFQARADLKVHVTGKKDPLAEAGGLVSLGKR